MGDDVKTILKNQKGQAIFELIIFLPFLIFLYTIYSTTGNAINGSINQQKAVRGYFYGLLRGNSYINTTTDLDEFSEKAISVVGFSALGWREKSASGGQRSFAPCFKFSSLLKNDSSEECDSKERDEDNDGQPISRYVRVFTFYGICGPVYNKISDGGAGNYYDINPAQQNNPGNCILSN